MNKVLLIMNAVINIGNTIENSEKKIQKHFQKYSKLSYFYTIVFIQQTYVSYNYYDILVN